MPWPVYMDVHVPATISAGLRLREIDVLTCQEDGSDRWSDERLLARATSLGRVLFTQDDDLLRLVSTWQQQDRPFSGVVYAHQLSAGIGTLVQDLELVLACCKQAELANNVRYLPLR